MSVQNDFTKPENDFIKIVMSVSTLKKNIFTITACSRRIFFYALRRSDVIPFRKVYFYILLLLILLNSQLFLLAQWKETGRLIEGREYHSVVKLENGKVLISGGIKPFGEYSFEPISSCEIYDPQSETWSEAALMNYNRYMHSSLLLPNNKVLVIGGYSNYNEGSMGGNLNSCEIYDPESNIWQLTDTLKVKTYGVQQSAIICSNGNVFSINCAESYPDQPYFFIGQMYDYNTGKWALTDTLDAIDYGFRLSRIGDSVLVIGGMWGDTNCEMYYASDNSWKLITPMNEGRSNHTATILLNGNILVTGGESYRGTSMHPKAGCEILNINTMEWNYVTPMIYSRLGHQAVLLKNGKVLVVGGMEECRSNKRISQWAISSVK